MDSLFRTLQWLDLQFSNPREALERRRERPPAKALRDFREDHLPFLIAYPFLLLISPWTYIRLFLREGFPSVRGALIPPVIVLGALLLAVFYDKIREFRSGPVFLKDRSAERNVALFFSLPVSASLIFFLVHPAVGYLALFSSVGFSFLQYARFEADLRKCPLRNVFAEMTVAGGFLLMPVVGLLILYNLTLSARIVLELFSGTGL